MTTLSLAAVSGLHGETGVALSADHLLALVFTGESSKRWLNFDGAETATSETEHKMEGGLLLDVIVLKGAAILKLLSGED